MLSSPAKRRKTSETTAAAVDASQTNQQAHENNGRVNARRHPSFQSPTKASLARSHPDILARAINRSPTRAASRGSRNGSGQDEQAESRIFGLRDRKALRPSLTSTASPIDGPKQSPNRRSSGLAAFAAPPRRVSRRIGPLDLTLGTPDMKSQNPPADQRPEDTPEDQLASELDSATGDMNANNLDGDLPFLQKELQEPDLPPTPTQLGLERPPGRIKGLMSSSPTAQYEKRARRRVDDTFKPSPLKLKSFEAGVESGEIPGEDPATDQALLSESALKKREVRKDLFVELQQLKDDIAELETWTAKVNQPESRTKSTEDLRRLLSLLSSDNASQKQSALPPKAPISSTLSALLPFSTKAPPKPQQELPSPTNPFTLKEHAQTKQYLTVFAPLNLKTHSSEVSSSRSNCLTETHKLTLSARPPFPPKLYNATVIYETNPAAQSITSVSVLENSETSESNIPDSLRRWINTRLSNPLLKLDVSGLCWGINRYWEAAVSRAQLWSRIEDQHSKLFASRSRRQNRETEGTSNKNDTGQLSTADLLRLIPHLDRTTMTFSSKKNDHLRFLLSCTLTLDEWTSEPRLLPEISISASSTVRGEKVEQEAKKLFHTLLRGEREQSNLADGVEVIDADAIVRAVDGVVGVLFGVDIPAQQYSKGKMPTRR